jgi:hypothetical protein
MEEKEGLKPQPWRVVEVTAAPYERAAECLFVSETSIRFAAPGVSHRAIGAVGYVGLILGFAKAKQFQYLIEACSIPIGRRYITYYTTTAGPP